MRAAVLCSGTFLLLFIGLGLGEISLKQSRSLVNSNSKPWVGCDNLNLSIKCKDLYPTICVSEASFEQTGKNICPNRPNGKENTTCTNDDVLEYVRRNCNGEKLLCKFNVSSKAVGNHCEGAFRYIMVTVNCAKSKCNEEEMKVVSTTRPMLLEITNRKDSESKTTNILPSFSSPTMEPGYGSPSAIFPTKNNLQTSLQSQPSQQTFQFPARRPSVQGEDWVDTTSVPVSATKKTCSRSRFVKKARVPSFTHPTKVETRGRNGCGKLSMHLLLKVVLFCVGFVV